MSGQYAASFSSCCNLLPSLLREGQFACGCRQCFLDERRKGESRTDTGFAFAWRRRLPQAFAHWPAHRKPGRPAESHPGDYALILAPARDRRRISKTERGKALAIQSFIPAAYLLGYVLAKVLFEPNLGLILDDISCALWAMVEVRGTMLASPSQRPSSLVDLPPEQAGGQVDQQQGALSPFVEERIKLHKVERRRQA
jgi:hypothetical protein